MRGAGRASTLKPCGAAVAAVTAVAAGGPAAAQLRVATWNVTDYAGAGSRDAAFRLVAYGVFEGRSMAPDLILGQEFLSAGALADFVALLNSAAGSPGDWSAAPFVDGPDTDQVLLYRTSRVVHLATTVVATGGAAPNHPRHVMRFDVRPVGYTGAGATLACYCSHMKSGGTASDQGRRLLEAQRIRNDAETLDPAWNFLLGADLNIPSATEGAYQELIGLQPVNSGRLFDPIMTTGGWNNNSAFRFVHTQEPTGDMDDRFDQLLLSASLRSASGFDYRGSLALPYSTFTWNDANHSYRAWGNDGASSGQPLTTAGNTMVGAAIALAIITTAAGNGHIPVFLDLRVPAEVGSPLLVDFGTVPQGAAAAADIGVINTGDTALWTAGGIADLRYTLAASTGFSAPAGAYVEPAGGAGNVHVISMDTSTPGPKQGILSIGSDAPDEPLRFVALTGIVAAACYADCTGDGILTVADFACFQGRFVGGDPYADCDASGGLTIADFGCFQASFAAGCP